MKNWRCHLELLYFEGVKNSRMHLSSNYGHIPDLWRDSTELDLHKLHTGLDQLIFYAFLLLNKVQFEQVT